MTGFFAVSRDFWADTAFRDEPMSEREAFLWLISKAAFRDRDFDINGKTVHLKRGQCAGSLRYLASVFKWSEGRVRRYLKRLKTRQMIDTPIDAARDAGLTVITLCNYEKYQGGAASRDTSTSATGVTKQNKENKNNIPMSGPPNREFDKLWSIWPMPGRKRTSKKKALMAFQKACHSHASDEVLRAAALYARSPDAIKDGGQFVPGLHTWLKDERFEPFLEAEAMRSAPGSVVNSTITPWRY